MACNDIFEIWYLRENCLYFPSGKGNIKKLLQRRVNFSNEMRNETNYKVIGLPNVNKNSLCKIAAHIYSGSTCSPLASIPNGRVVGTSTKSGATVLFFCNSGYMLSSSSTNFRTCQSSGSWSGSQPSCIGKLARFKDLFPVFYFLNLLVL